eukprot:jgi/Psemu1/28014/gm1.28014_g
MNYIKLCRVNDDDDDDDTNSRPGKDPDLIWDGSGAKSCRHLHEAERESSRAVEVKVKSPVFAHRERRERLEHKSEQLLCLGGTDDYIPFHSDLIYWYTNKPQWIARTGGYQTIRRCVVAAVMITITTGWKPRQDTFGYYTFLEASSELVTSHHITCHSFEKNYFSTMKHTRLAPPTTASLTQHTTRRGNPACRPTLSKYFQATASPFGGSAERNGAYNAIFGYSFSPASTPQTLLGHLLNLFKAQAVGALGIFVVDARGEPRLRLLVHGLHSKYPGPLAQPSPNKGKSFGYLDDVEGEAGELVLVDLDMLSQTTASRVLSLEHHMAKLVAHGQRPSIPLAPEGTGHSELIRAHKPFLIPFELAMYRDLPSLLRPRAPPPGDPALTAAVPALTDHQLRLGENLDHHKGAQSVGATCKHEKTHMIFQSQVAARASELGIQAPLITTAALKRFLDGNFHRTDPFDVADGILHGGEFLGHEFQNTLATYGIEGVATTVKNPQSNAVCERVHHTIADTLRILVHVNPPQNNTQATQLMDNVLATCMHASRCAINASMGSSPGALVFNRDSMLLDIPLTSNLIALQQIRQQGINMNLLRQNAKRIKHIFKVDDKVWMKEPDPDKLQPQKKGPYQIVQVRTNGTVKLRLSPNVTGTVNIKFLSCPS